jgi:hypothetical protein
MAAHASSNGAKLATAIADQPKGCQQKSERIASENSREPIFDHGIFAARPVAGAVT